MHEEKSSESKTSIVEKQCGMNLRSPKDSSVRGNVGKKKLHQFFEKKRILWFPFALYVARIFLWIF